MLTNFPVIQRRLKRLLELRAMQEKGDFERMSTKEANVHRDDLDRLEANFAGMVNMKRVPGALFIIDCKKERLAVSEANKLGIPIVAIVDTNCDPNEIQHVIPGNDDAIRSCKLIVNMLTDAILEGQQLLSERELREQEEAAQRERQEREAAERAAAAAAAKADNEEGTPEVAVEEFAATAGADTEAQ